MPNNFESNGISNNEINNGNASRAKNKKSIGKIISNVFFGLAVVFFAYVALTIATAEDKSTVSFFGYRPAFILTGSMEPQIKQYAIVLLKDVEYEDVEVGDVIAYQYDEKSIVHQVIAVTPDGLICQGTNNGAPDQYYITEDMVYAEVVWWTNIINTFITNPVTFIYFLIMIVSSVVFVRTLIKWIRSRMQNKAYEQVQTQAPVQEQVQTQAQAPVQAQDQDEVQRQIQAQVQKQVQEQMQMLAQAQAQAQAQMQAQAQAPVQEQVQNLAQAQTQVQEQMQKMAQEQMQNQAQAQAQAPVQNLEIDNDEDPFA